MCGIVAMLSKGQPVSPQVMDRALSVLHHRGPDAQRQWIGHEGRVGLGHARLSIIDLQGGDQPIATDDEALRVIVNGEFYDFQRIRRELETRGHHFRTHSDSEIVLHLYREYGPQCLHHLRGEFALALWDERSRQLFVARDRFGIKPLFYAWHGDTLYFASEAKALFRAGVPARWDLESVHQATQTATPLQGRSLFAGVYQVPPGHYGLATEGGLQFVRYWDFDYPREDAQAPVLRDEEYAEQLREVLEESIRLRLHADVPVAIYLSGGLDSCAVLGLAQRLRGAPLHAFTLGFDHPAFDESAVAREMAERTGSRFTLLPVQQGDLAGAFSDALWHGESLLLNANSVAKFLLSRVVRDAGYKVVLTGEGSDEVFAGYAHFRRDMLLYDNRGIEPETLQRMMEALEASNQTTRGILMPDGSIPKNELVSRVLGFVPSFLEAVSTTAVKARALYAPGFAARFEGRDPLRALLDGLDVRGQLTGRSPVHQSLYLWGRSALPNAILSILGDRMEMAHSIEGRVPFLDHLLVERVRNFPLSQKIRNGTEKYVLREVARPVVTDTIYRRQKQPFAAPPSSLKLEGPFFGLLQDTLRGSALDAQPIFEPQRIRAVLDRMPQMEPTMRIGAEPALLAALSICLLQERFGL